MPIQKTDNISSNIFNKYFPVDTSAGVNKPISVPNIKNTQPDSFEKSNNSNKQDPFKIILSFGALFIAGGVVAAGTKKLFSNPKYLKELSKELLGKEEAIDKVYYEAINKINDFTSNFQKNVGDLIKPNRVKSTDLYNPQEIKEAKTKEQLLKLEETYISGIEKNFAKEIDSMPEQIQNSYVQYSRYKNEFITKLDATIKDANIEIKNIAQVPPGKVAKQKAKDLVGTFNETANYRLLKLENLKTEKLKSVGDEIVAKSAFVNDLADFVDSKHNSINSVLEDVRLAIKNISPKINETKTGEIQESTLEIIPASLPKSILENSFFKLVQNTNLDDKQELIRNSAEFINEMSSKLSLKDIDTMISRLDLRAESVWNNSIESAYYKNTIEKMKKTREILEEVLSTTLKNSGKNIDIQALTTEKAQDVAFILQNHSEKMGYRSVSEMMNHFALDCTDSIINKPIYNIYQKISPEIKDSGMFYNWSIDNKVL